MKKKILALLLSVCVAGSVAGCSGSQLSNDYITITQYKGLEVDQVETTEVTDEMVESEISSRLSSETTTDVITDRAAQEGDTVNIDFTGSIDGVEFDGGSAVGTNLVLGSGAMIGASGDYAGFEDQLIGHNTGDEFTITVQFPDVYDNNPDLAGKVADFAIKMNSISVVSTPELTDDWVKENSEESETVDEFKKEVKAELEESYNSYTEYVLKNEVIQALIDKTEVKEFPENEVEDEVAEMNEYYESQAENYGVEFSEFLSSYLNMTEDEYSTQVQEVAEDTVTLRLALDLLADKKKLEPTEEEYLEAFDQYVEDYGFESRDAMIELVGEDALKELVLQDVIADYLVQSCVQVEADED